MVFKNWSRFSIKNKQTQNSQQVVEGGLSSFFFPLPCSVHLMCVQNICFKFRMFSLNKKSCRMRKKGDLSNFEILTPNHLAPTAMPFRNWLSKGIFPKNHQLDLYRECSNKESEQQSDNGQIALNWHEGNSEHLCMHNTEDHTTGWGLQFM